MLIGRYWLNTLCLQNITLKLGDPSHKLFKQFTEGDNKDALSLHENDSRKASVHEERCDEQIKSSMGNW